MSRPSLPASSWLRGLRFSGFSFIMMGILVLGVLIIAPSLGTLVAQRQQIAALQEQVDAQQADVEALRAERERWNDTTFVTTQARDRLGYVLPGEVSFLVINDLPVQPGSTDDTPISAEIQDTQVDWAQSLFNSFMTAGLAPAISSEDPAP